MWYLIPAPYYKEFKFTQAWSPSIGENGSNFCKPYTNDMATLHSLWR